MAPASSSPATARRGRLARRAAHGSTATAARPLGPPRPGRPHAETRSIGACRENEASRGLHSPRLVNVRILKRAHAPLPPELGQLDSLPLEARHAHRAQELALVESAHQAVVVARLGAL